MRPNTRHGTGQTGEYLVAAELARMGFMVALPTGNAEAVDILAYGFGKTLAIQVKTAGRGDHQFNLGKFIDVEFHDDGRQEVHGRLRGLDTTILIVLVFLGTKAGEDEFTWALLNDFADFLAEEHSGYLLRKGGRRPGGNPKSLHAAHSKKVLQERFPGRNVFDVIAFNPL